MHPNIKYFNLRVYAIIISNNNEVLLCDEYHRNMKMTKFPGGGLQFEEGAKECLKREALEEFGQEVIIIDHFYTTDFFQKALFYDDHQLFSIYYKASFFEPPKFKISTKPFDFELKNGNISFRWKKIKKLSKNDLSFPIDQYVVELIRNNN